MRLVTQNANGAIDFRQLDTTPTCSGICYVVSAKHGVKRDSKPFFTLYLRDINNVTIPGYVFDLDNYVTQGVNLTKVQGKLIRAKFVENYLAGYGMTVILENVELCVDAPVDLISKFTGEIEDSNRKLDSILKYAEGILGVPIIIPMRSVMVSSEDYSGGRVGGVLDHYVILMSQLKTYESIMEDDEFRQLIATAMVYIFSHMTILNDGDPHNVNHITCLTDKASKISNALKAQTGIMEAVHCHFGYKPKDVYTRIVDSTFYTICKTTREMTCYRALPATREGNAGYGDIHRY